MEHRVGRDPSSIICRYLEKRPMVGHTYKMAWEKLECKHKPGLDIKHNHEF